MIVLPEQQVVIFTPPKCASTSLHDAFCDHRGPGIEVHGPLPNQPPIIEAHTFVVPRRFRHFRALCIVRHPYARARSLWKHAVTYTDYQGDFQQFVLSVLIGKSRIWWNWPAATFARFGAMRIGMALNFVRVEKLHFDLQSNGVTPPRPIEWEHVNGAHEADPPAEHNTRAMIHRWGADDFEAGKYAQAVSSTSTVQIPYRAPQWPGWDYTR